MKECEESIIRGSMLFHKFRLDLQVIEYSREVWVWQFPKSQSPSKVGFKETVPPYSCNFPMP